MLNFMAFALTVKCVQYKCHISVLAFLVLYCIVSKWAFHVFFLWPFQTQPWEKCCSLFLPSPNLVPALACVCDLSVLVYFLCKLDEPRDLFLFTLHLQRYFFLHVYSAPFETLKCSFWFSRPQEQLLVLGKLVDLQTVPLLSEVVMLLLWFFLFSVCIPLPSYCSSWSCQAFKCKLFGEELYVLMFLYSYWCTVKVSQCFRSVC